MKNKHLNRLSIYIMVFAVSLVSGNILKAEKATPQDSALHHEDILDSKFYILPSVGIAYGNLEDNQTALNLDLDIYFKFSNNFDLGLGFGITNNYIQDITQYDSRYDLDFNNNYSVPVYLNLKYNFDLSNNSHLSPYFKFGISNLVEDKGANFVTSCGSLCRIEHSIDFEDKFYFELGLSYDVNNFVIAVNYKAINTDVEEEIEKTSVLDEDEHNIRSNYTNQYVGINIGYMINY